MRRFFFAFFALLLLCGSAFAFPPKQTYQWRVGSSILAGPDIVGNVCPAVAGYMASKQIKPQCSYGTVFCTFTGTPSGTSSCSVQRQPGGFTEIIPLENAGLRCPPNSTLVNGECVCDAGFVESAGTCIKPEDACKEKQGKSYMINVTTAWQRTPSVGANAEWLYPLKITNGGGSVCNQGCKQDFSLTDPCPGCGAYVSQVPNAQGLYRVSTDFMGTYSGGACTEGPADNAIKPDDTKDPPCPGFVGEVNGVKGCYGTADKPIRPEESDPNHDRLPKEGGNPAAGLKPTSGEGSGSGGSGRTPSAGTGGSAGGPIGAAGSGTKPNGTTDKPSDGKEQQNCGAPGQPSCKIDETGTPTGHGSKDKLKEAVDQAGKDTKAAIQAATALKADGWSFTFQMPTGCTPLVLDEFSFSSAGLSIDVCRWQSIIHDIMSMIWIAATVWCCIGMVGATLRGA